MPEACIELLGHDASFKSARSVGRVNQVTIAGHHESHKCDAHSILVKEDVWVRAAGRNTQVRGSLLYSSSVHIGIAKVYLY